MQGLLVTTLEHLLSKIGDNHIHDAAVASNCDRGPAYGTVMIVTG